MPCLEVTRGCKILHSFLCVDCQLRLIEYCYRIGTHAKTISFRFIVIIFMMIITRFSVPQRSFPWTPEYYYCNSGQGVQDSHTLNSSSLETILWHCIYISSTHTRAHFHSKDTYIDGHIHIYCFNSVSLQIIRSICTQPICSYENILPCLMGQSLLSNNGTVVSPNRPNGLSKWLSRSRSLEFSTTVSNSRNIQS